MEYKGFRRFRAPKESKNFSVVAGTLTVDRRIYDRIQRVVKKYGNNQKYGALAVKTEGDAVSLLLEHYIYQKQRSPKPKQK